MKILWILFFICVFSISIFSQTTELTLEKGVLAHKEIDSIYKSFSEAYKTLDVEKVASLYSENAAYLPPDNDILQGREAIRPTFKEFFDWVKSEGRTMTISFQIFQRKVDKNLAYDVGVYTIRQFKDGKQVGGLGQGKFVTVAVKEKDGKWRFQVDGYSNLKPPEKK
ncbi:MAG TPA: SgcJ/EcaC family oxidoreductase [Pyrinomonadaceae bacterium]|nr:SgcJ/EcaC family oxidoreductase [Pyrinomonadaceae bacterium]